MLEAFVRPSGPYSLALSARLASDATRTFRDGVLRSTLVVESRVERAVAWQVPDVRVVARAGARPLVDRPRLPRGPRPDRARPRRRPRPDQALLGAARSLGRSGGDRGAAGAVRRVGGPREPVPPARLGAGLRRGA